MSHPIHHSETSKRLFGGTTTDYLPVHHYLDATKECFADCRHRALRHHQEGIGWALKAFPTSRSILEQHILEDCAGQIPSIESWAAEIRSHDWMKIIATPGEVLEATAGRFGGAAGDYRDLLGFLLEYQAMPEMGYLRLHSQGIFELERIFGVERLNSPVRYIGEFMVKKMLNTNGRIPSACDWLRCMRLKVWMNRSHKL